MTPSDAVGIGDQPVLVYDDDCGFCTYWTEWVARRSDVAVVGFSELTPDIRDRLPADYERGAHLIQGEAVHSFGESMEEAFVLTEPGRQLRWVVESLRRFDRYERLRERVYGWISDNRAMLGEFTSAEPPVRVERDGGRRR